MAELVKYEAARRALAEAHRVDEVKDIRNKAAAMQHYAMQAKDRELIDMATDLKLRAERRAGELLAEMPKHKGGNPNLTGSAAAPVGNTPKLHDIGITKKESSRWQKLAAMPEKQFEEKLVGVKTALRAKTEGESRPKGKGKPQTKPRTAPAADIKQQMAAAVLDDRKTLEQAAAEFGATSVQHVKLAVAEEKGRRKAEPIITPDMLSMSAQEKLDAAIRQHQRKLDATFERRVLDEIKRRIDEIILPHWKKQIDEAQQLYARRRGLMDKTTFNKIRRGLHPDSRNAISDKVLGEAFDTFMGLEKFLLNEKDSPTEVGAGLPGSWAEWEAAKQHATAARRAKRHANPMRRQ
jgi:hypothetical protein